MAFLRQGNLEITVNGQSHPVQADPETPLLYVLRNELNLNAAKFGCGLSQCGACTVLVDGEPVRSCVLPMSEIGAAEVTTLEGLGTIDAPHPIQQAFLAEQAAQCGYCIPGMMMSAAALLAQNSQPTDADIREALSGNLCRCGTHVRILRAVHRAVDGAI
ncbi:MAG: (2Fe-2S)-binding protein [Thermomicrobiales bacterium]